jgi:hypothetical protein
MSAIENRYFEAVNDLTKTIDEALNQRSQSMAGN